MQKRSIKKVAVLGSGIMGSRIACHFAGIGVQVLLLDMQPKAEEGKPFSPNKIVNDALAAAIKSNPSPVYHAAVAQHITTGNFTDNMKDIATCDWVIEVVIEKLEIKHQVLNEVDKYRKQGTLITSNTSGIPIHLMAEGKTDDFKAHFCGTHFFNPPRYLRLLEIIPTAFTNKEVVDFLMHYGDLFLGKQTVLCKDTPAFIANRIGVFSMMAVFKAMDKIGLTVDEIDFLMGPVFGRPKSAIFRTADLVGIDTLVKVAIGVTQNCPNDEALAIFSLPAWLQKMLDNNWLGDKTGQGFFKKTKNAAGEKEILSLNLKTMEYEARIKTKFASVEAAKAIESLPNKIKMLQAATDKAGAFYQQFHFSLFSYISHRIPEISNNLFSIDDAMKAGFGWEIGAFETWDALGIANTVNAMQQQGYSVANWVTTMLEKGINSFYTVQNGNPYYYDINTQQYQPINVEPNVGKAFIVMNHYQNNIVWKNTACQLYHLGDEVLGLEWNTKMNTIGGEVLQGIQKSISIAEEKYKGLVIANSGANFSAGANIGMIFMFAIEQEWDELNMAIHQFQQTMMRARYSSIPVVVAPHGLTLGGGCELNLHADKVCAAAETYIGLVEMGVGVIPAGGGTKEFVLRASKELHKDEPETNTLKERFFAIATAKVATSAHEAFNMGILRKGYDEIVVNQARRIAAAKQSVINLYNAGYTMPIQATDIKVLGQQGLGAMHAGVHAMYTGGYATEHDAKIAKKLAYVMCGGNLSEPSLVSEQYLLDLEREAFLSLCGERKTLQRIQSVLKTGKPIRN